MKERVFLDTNILLDVLAEREEFYADSARLWTLCEQNTIAGLISVISFNNIYYILRKLQGRKVAQQALSRLRLVFSPVALDERVLDQGIAAGFEDFEDALQYFSAISAQVSCIVSRNSEHFPGKPAIPIMTPAEYLRVRAVP